MAVLLQFESDTLLEVNIYLSPQQRKNVGQSRTLSRRLIADNSVDKVIIAGDFIIRLDPNDHFRFANFKVPSTDNEEEQYYTHFPHHSIDGTANFAGSCLASMAKD